MKIIPALILVPFFFSANCLANHSETPHQRDDFPLLSKIQEELIDTGQQKASTMVIDAASWFDNFFDDERYTVEENRTRAKLRVSLGYSENEDFEAKVRVAWRIHLPKLSKKLNLIILAGDDDEFNVGDNPITDPIDNEKEDLSAALQYFLKVGEKYNLSTTVGGSYDYAYGGIRFRHFHDLGAWNGRIVDRLRYYTDDGWENRLSYDLERRISEHWLFRTTAAVNWFEDMDGYPHALHFRLYQLLDKDRALSYEVTNYFETEPDYILTDLQLRFRYRQRFYRDWLILEVAPQLTFPKDHDRDINPGLVVQLEADFGYLSDTKVFKSIFN